MKRNIPARRGSGIRWAVLLGLAFIAALGLAILLLWPAAGPGESRSYPGRPIPLPLEPTAREAYRAAQGVARSWQPDAQLASLSAQWRPTRGRWPVRSTWTFLFYSPAVQRMAVVVAEAGQARLLQDAPTPYPLPVFAEDRWRVDSPQALEAWWARGGADVLARPGDIGITVQLGPVSPADPTPAWTITAIVGNQVHTIRLSAVDGQAIP